MGAFTTASANFSPERQEVKIRSLNKVIVICHLGQDPADPLHLACPSLKRPERTERELVPTPKNWRRHPKAQTDALRGLLNEIGYADALLVRELPDGRYMIIDGHLRAEATPNSLVPLAGAGCADKVKRARARSSKRISVLSAIAGGIGGI